MLTTKARIRCRVWVCSAATVFSVLGCRLWTDDQVLVQAMAYSVLVLGLLLIGFAEEWQQPRFGTTALLVLALHAVVLYAGRSLLPVPTTFLLWMAAGVESTVLGLFAAVMLGKSTRLVKERSRERVFSTAGGRVGR